MTSKLSQINGDENHKKQEAEQPLMDKRHPVVFTDKMLEQDFDEIYKNYPLTEDTTCGIGFIKGRLLQKCANKKVFVFVYGIVGCVFSATYAYFNGTLTTMEKRFKIPSQNLGIISIGNDVSSLFLSAILSYYAGKQNRPRWIAVGLVALTLFCVFSSLPHYLWGAGEQALSLTKEYGANEDSVIGMEIMERERRKKMCNVNTTETFECEKFEGNWAPQVLLFVGQLIAGVGQCLYYTLGVAFIDDNVKKSKTPALISFSYFLRLLGPAGGYALASFCLKIYVSPDLTPTIDNKDPRWLGAWWLGWLILAVSLFGFAFLMIMFPKELPRASLRKRIAAEKKKRGIKNDDGEDKSEEIPASFKDMLVTFKRLLLNATFMLNNIASIFYYFGYMPYWIFTPKYIETQYKQTASTASFTTGTVALVFSAIGILSSGIVISKCKPKARSLALWNVFVGALSVIGMISYVYLGCAENENSVVLNTPLPDAIEATCNSNCHCDYVNYSPVCGADKKTYISPCHAGCKVTHKFNGTKKFFTDCSCIDGHFDDSELNFTLPKSIEINDKSDDGRSKFDSTFVNMKSYILGNGSAKDGTCSINCQKEFILFLAVMCMIKFTGATGRASNFLVGVRCIEERDKTVAMGFGLAFMCLFSFMPSPIFFGTLLDRMCIVWGKTCNGKGNCWLYDTEGLRFYMNLIAAGFVTLGVIFDISVWYCVKDLKIFDDEVKAKEIEMTEKKEETQSDKK